MNQKVIQPGAKPFLLFLWFTGLAAAPFYTNPYTVPYWAGGLMFIFALAFLLNAKRIILTDEQITIRYIILGRTATMIRSEIEAIRVYELPSTMASRMGLMRRGEMVRIHSVSGRTMAISTATSVKFNVVVQFLEDYYGDKFVD